MTTSMIPDYVLALYENEIRKVVQKVLKNISEEFNIDIKELEKSAASEVTLKLISEDFESVTITRKNKVKKLVENEKRCVARIKKNGLYMQCTRESKDDMMCKMHSTKKLLHGTINDPLPKENVTRGKKCVH